MRPISIAVAGCGPAGLAAALYLRRAGHDVTLLERFETPKPLGSGLMLQPTGLAVLGDLGLRTKMIGLGARISRLHGQSSSTGRTVLDVKYAAVNAHAFGLAVHRTALFDVLYDAVRTSGIEIRTGFTVSGLETDDAGRHGLVSKTGDTLGPYDLVIDALGTRSPLPEAVFGCAQGRPLAYGALWANLEWPEDGPFDIAALEQRYDHASIMVGVLPIGRRYANAVREAAFFWSLKPVHYDDWLRAGLDAWKDHVRRIWPQTSQLLDQIRDPDQLVLARYSHHTLPSPIGPGIAFIGDCAHSASPQLGQGANMALVDAMALGLAVERSADVAEALSAYAGMRRNHVRLYQAMSRLFTPFYQSDSIILPAVRDWLVAPLAGLPLAQQVLARLVTGILVHPLGTTGARVLAQRQISFMPGPRE